ncbi:MAG TPA: hypothetical protein VF755_12185 [Catenuloplanes sp.]
MNEPRADERIPATSLASSAERVWRAVSVPAELERWFPAATDWTPATAKRSKPPA